MRAKRVIPVITVAGIFACLLASVTAFASGGIYLTDIRITNDGTTVFADDFHTGDLSGWFGKTDATVVFPKPNSPPGVLYLNSHSTGYAEISHRLDISKPGLVEMSASLFVTPADEQERLSRFTACPLYLKLHSVGDDCTCKTGCPGKLTGQPAQCCVSFHRGETACRLQIHTEMGCGEQQNGVFPGGSQTNSPVLSSGKWVSLRLRLDPGTSTLSLMMDGRLVLSTPYDPGKVHNIGLLAISSGFGDGGRAGK